MDFEFNPDVISYEDLLWMFWKGHDPYTKHKNQYMSAIFYNDDEQKALAEKTRDKIQEGSARPIATVIRKAETFYNAENYHQKYMLRQDHQLLSALKLSDEELIKSTAAAKLNGYVRGFGTMADFEADKNTFGLPPNVMDHLQKKVKSRLK